MSLPSLDSRLLALMNLFRFSQPTLLERLWQAVRYPYDLVRRPIDVFSSIPTLSILLIPTFSSYSTSLNLVLFYLTWSTLILSNSPLKVEFIGTLAVRVLFYILPSLGFLLFDSALPSVAVNIKEHGDAALALSDERGGRNGRWWRVTLVSIGNVLLSVMLQVGIEYVFTEIFHIRSSLRITTSLPLPWSIVKDLFRGLVLREVLSYTIHRIVLHSPESPLTSYHKSWYHTLPVTYSLTAHYDHPIAYIFHMFLPVYLPSILFRFHLLTYHIYLTLISLEETFAYSGYNVLPRAFILGGMARRQERHLMSGAEGNYGCWGICDFVMGSGLSTEVLEGMRDEAEQKEVPSRPKRKGKGVVRKGRKRSD